MIPDKVLPTFPVEWWSEVLPEVKKGWAQGTYGAWRQSDGPVCLNGAAFRVVNQHGWDPTQTSFMDFRIAVSKAAFQRFPDRMPGHIPGTDDSVVFNDHKLTTKTNVLDVLRETVRNV